MFTRFIVFRFVLAFVVCQSLSAAKPTPSPARSAAPPAASPTAPKVTKPVVDQTAQTIIYCYHRLVDKVRYPGTEITPAAFEAQMKELKRSRHYCDQHTGSARLEARREKHPAPLRRDHVRRRLEISI